MNRNNSIYREMKVAEDYLNLPEGLRISQSQISSIAKNSHQIPELMKSRN